MTPEVFIAAGQRLYGRKFWKTKLANDLGVDVSTIHRITHRTQVPGPYEVALRGLLEHKRRQDELTKEARRMASDRKRLSRVKINRAPMPPREPE